MIEIWKSVSGYEDSYEVSNLGRVRSLARMTKHPRGGMRSVPTRALKGRRLLGYSAVTLQSFGRIKVAKIHRLVALAFMENPEGKPHVNHLDGNKGNNRVDNLEWATVSENNRHSYTAGLRSRLWGQNAKRAGV